MDFLPTESKVLSTIPKEFSTIKTVSFLLCAKDNENQIKKNGQRPV